jgi:hypothetical protein
MLRPLPTMWHVFVLYCINEYFVLVLDYLFIYIQQACKIYNIAGTFNSEICILLTLSVNSISSSNKPEVAQREEVCTINRACSAILTWIRIAWSNYMQK